ncbi:hypothetical protein BCIN_12g04340 [Botrytis cinerea B05.10]|uniref:Uncharacterized protein n=1 Tax=Botryotinia fuckeliana (strain B05.10) TaxID=332648 RepID=A0A384JZS9_BOTFB|nr:hypothetical protein BCIN_12g04340 [Botrytis cinerea B05.10]ATZ55884.1 hypothetical protein BCIN_12g04340 [Botrytis cinerea B05.10]
MLRALKLVMSPDEAAALIVTSTSSTHQAHIKYTPSKMIAKEKKKNLPLRPKGQNTKPPAASAAKNVSAGGGTISKAEKKRKKKDAEMEEEVERRVKQRLADGNQEASNAAAGGGEEMPGVEKTLVSTRILTPGQALRKGELLAELAQVKGVRALLQEEKKALKSRQAALDAQQKELQKRQEDNQTSFDQCVKELKSLS